MINNSIKNNIFFINNSNTGIIKLTASLCATILGSSAVIGMSGFGYKIGLPAAWWILSGAVGLVILYSVIDKFDYSHCYTFPDLMSEMFGNKIKVLSGILIYIAWLAVIAAQFLAGANIISAFLNINFNLSLFIITLITLSYTIAGGQKAVINTDFIQFIFILFFIALLYIFLTKNYATDIKSFLNLNTAKELVRFPVNNNFNYTKLFIMLITVSIPYVIGPDIHTRLYSAKNKKIAKKSIILTVIFLVPIAFSIAFLGIIGNTLIPEINKSDNILILLSLKTLNPILKTFFLLGLFSVVLSSADTCLFTASSIFSNNILKIKNKKNACRILIFFTGILVFSICYFSKSNILGMLFLAYTIFTSAFTIPVLVKIMFKNIILNPKTIFLCIMAGPIITLLIEFLVKHHYINFISANFALPISFLISIFIILIFK